MSTLSPDPGVIVGAYASSPTTKAWDPRLEQAYLDHLTAVPGVHGLEIPWITSLHAHDQHWYANHLPSEWTVTITHIGGTMHRLAENPRYGLASDDQEGRARAVADVAAIREDVARLNDAHGRQVVTGIEVHSAPATPAAASSATALAESLREIAQWEWYSADLLVEHCDEHGPGRPVDTRPVAKGFLSLDAELQAIADAGTGAGVVVNWGRSAIELGDPDRVAEHVRMARAAGVLRGIVFSGAADTATEYGPAWADAHLPFAPGAEAGTGAEGSLLTDARVVETLAEAGPSVWSGVKIACRPLDVPVERRVAQIRDGVERVLAARTRTDLLTQ
ncbi:DUF4862 family protein [Ruania halotolerans]|uniref:DUF4862 family protein n=1 Tax=Ruania halotolerans TaxID=2897773 RepID=UPI001E37AFC5|nr:DUF4862 family protein [Ruania halotolerans]UFU08063.1 DUF4862 family protein [Ruania halotolerans]